MESRRSNYNYCLTLTLITVGIILCIVAVLGIVDQGCVDAANDWIPYYPNATIIKEEYTYLRPFGIGNTSVELRSPDSRSTVFRWYIDHISEVSKEQSRSQLIAELDWQVTENADGTSTIMLSSFCFSE